MGDSFRMRIHTNLDERRFWMGRCSVPGHRSHVHASPTATIPEMTESRGSKRGKPKRAAIRLGRCSLRARLVRTGRVRQLNGAMFGPDTAIGTRHVLSIEPAMQRVDGLGDGRPRWWGGHSTKGLASSSSRFPPDARRRSWHPGSRPWTSSGEDAFGVHSGCRRPIPCGGHAAKGGERR